MGFRQRGKRKEWMAADTWKAVNNRPTLEKFIVAKSERKFKKVGKRC